VVTPEAQPVAGDGGADAAPGKPIKLASRVVAYARSSLGNLPMLAATVNLHEISHLIITFANPNDTAPLALSSSDADVAVMVNAAHAAGAKVLVALGGSSGTPRTLPFLAPDKVQGFVQTVVDFVEARNFDGVDVDVEDAGIPAANYEALVKGLSAALKPKGKLVTAAVASWFDAVITPAAFALMDFGERDGLRRLQQLGRAALPALQLPERGRRTGPLRPGAQAARRQGGAGVPFYGYCWGAGCGKGDLTWAEIVARFPARARG
jgi:hypothetical protein